MNKFVEGQKVKVVVDFDISDEKGGVPVSPWVGAIGEVMIAGGELYTLRITEGNPYHDNDNTAVFRESELEAV